MGKNHKGARYKTALHKQRYAHAAFGLSLDSLYMMHLVPSGSLPFLPLTRLCCALQVVF